MSKADEMFKELGYKKKENEREIKYTDENIIMGDKFHFAIIFVKNLKTVGAQQLLNMQELQAINQKVKELRLEQLDRREER